MIASTLLLDPRLAMWTRFCGALYLFYTPGCVGIMVTNLIELVASKPSVPFALMLVAILGTTVLAGDFVIAAHLVKLTAAATHTWTPHPVLGRLLSNL